MRTSPKSEEKEDSFGFFCCKNLDGPIAFHLSDTESKPASLISKRQQRRRHIYLCAKPRAGSEANMPITRTTQTSWTAEITFMPRDLRTSGVCREILIKN